MPGLGTALPSVALLLAAIAGCGPRVDSAAKADIDRRLKLVQPSGQRFSAPASPQPMPLAVGQWVQYKVVDKDKLPSFFTMKVVDQLNGVHSVEYVTEAYTGKTVTRLDLYVGDRANPATMDVRGARMMDAAGNVTEVPPATLGLMRGAWKGMLDLVSVRWQGLAQEEATVPAGTFAGCYKGDTEASFGLFTSKTRSWSHAVVPLSGLVRSEGVDEPSRMELVAFGEKGGGQSEIP